MASSYNIGDSVAVLDDNMEGVVVQVINNKVTIETLDGFNLEFESSELVLIDKGIDYHLKGAYKKQEEFSLEQAQKTKRNKPIIKSKVQPPMEVDLHIEKLTKSYKRLSNYEILNIQMEHAKHKIEFALLKKIQRVVFIHGVGQGVLKEELKFLFRNYQGIKYGPADYQKYGQGATEVYLTQKASRL